MPQRTTTDVLGDIVQIQGVNIAIVVGRDGFVIETAGAPGKVDIDLVGASVAMVLNGAEKMGQELKFAEINTLTLEYANAMLMCTLVSDALLVIVAPDSKSLGFIRVKIKALQQELAKFF